MGGIKKKKYLHIVFLIYISLSVGCMVNSNMDIKDKRSVIIELKDQLPISSNRTNFQIEGICEKCESFLFKLGSRDQINCEYNSDAQPVEKAYF